MPARIAEPSAMVIAAAAAIVVAATAALAAASAIVVIAASATLVAPDKGMASKAAIDADVRAASEKFATQVRGARDLAAKAEGVLVFPSVVKAGFGFGGEYGEGALLVRGQPTTYYNIVSASFGFQLGAQAQTVIIMFMTDQALASFRSAYGFKVGVDGSIVVVNIGAAGTIDTDSLTSPIIAFVLDPQGLMYSLSLEGSKITQIHPDP